MPWYSTTAAGADRGSVVLRRPGIRRVTDIGLELLFSIGQSLGSTRILRSLEPDWRSSNAWPTVSSGTVRETNAAGIDVAALEEASRCCELAEPVVHDVAQLQFLHHGGHAAESIGRRAHSGDDDPSVGGSSVYGDLHRSGHPNALEDHVVGARRRSLGRVVQRSGNEPSQ